MIVLRSTILVIDDDLDVLEAVSMLLERHFGQCAHVVGAGDGVQALAIALSAHPDLIVCDYAMPTMDGRAFVRRARSEPALRGVPIVMFSGEPALAALTRGLDVQALVGKADVEQLPEVARRLLGWKCGKACA
jgi:CheY-like chemotaxis protein